MKRIFGFLAGVVLLASFPTVQAADVEENYSYSKIALPEAAIGVGTRATAMGGAGAAACQDASALFWNPAGLAQTSKSELAFIHNNWIQGIYQETLLADIPFSDDFVMGVAGNYILLGSIDRAEAAPNNQLVVLNETMNLATYGGSLGAGFSVSPELSLGLASRVFVQDLGVAQITRSMADLGMHYHAPQNWTLAAVLKNLALGGNEYSLPATLSLGSAYHNRTSGRNDLTLAADLDLLLADMSASVFHLGLEYGLSKYFHVRAGYQFSGAPQPAGLVGLTFGVGAELGLWEVGYALATQGELGLTHRVSVALDLKGLAGEPGSAPRRRRAEPAAEEPATPRMELGFAPGHLTVAERPGRATSSTAVAKEEAAMRSLLAEGLSIEARVTKPSAKTKANREVHFFVKRTSGAHVAGWKLELTDANNEKVQILQGAELPKVIRWNGWSLEGKRVAEVRTIHYKLTVTDINAETESTAGVVGAAPKNEPVQPRAAAKAEPLIGEVRFGPILFSQGQADIAAGLEDAIAEAADFLRTHPGTKALVEGYTDAVDEQDKKTYLSKARAEAVVRYLTTQCKVPIARILMRGRGDSDPAADNADPDQRGQNRRVVITISAMRRK